MTKSAPTEAAEWPWFSVLTVAVAFVATFTLALFSAANVIGLDAIGAGQPAALLALAVCAAAFLAIEGAEARLLVHAERCEREEADDKSKPWRRRSMFARLQFLAAAVTIGIAGHGGMEALNDAFLSPRVAPLERAVARAEAAYSAAVQSLAAFEVRAGDEISEARRAVRLASGRERRAAEADEKEAKDRADDERAEKERAKSLAAEVVANAKATRERGPKGFSPELMVALGFVLVLFKGPFLWVATPRPRAGGRFTLQGVDRETIEAMSSEERKALASQAAAVSGLVRHAENRAKTGS